MNGHVRGYASSGQFYRSCAAKGMTQAETARAWGVSQVAVSRWANINLDVEFSRKSKRGLHASPRNPQSLTDERI